MRRRAVATVAALLALSATAFGVDSALRKKAKDPDSFKRSDAARELGAEGSPAAAKILAELIDDRNSYVRDHTVEACGKLSDAAAVAVIAALSKSKEVLLRRNVADAMGRTKTPGALETLGAMAESDKAAIVRATALDSLWGFKGNADALAVCKAAMGDADPLVRAAAVEAAVRMRADGMLQTVEQGLTDKNEGVRCVARMELRYADREAASSRLKEAVGDIGWRTRAQVVDDALYLRDAAAMEALVTLVGDKCLRVAAAAHRALKALSGKDFGRDAVIWKSWWEQNREGWKAPEGRLDATKTADDPDRTTARYHGVEVTSERLVFVVDASGSMKEKAKGAKHTRWVLARKELEAALSSLPDGTRVNVLLFQERVLQAFPKATALTKKSRKTAATFLKRTSPSERGDLLAAMLQAIALDDVDTVYLLSDGAPSAGEMVVKSRVRRAIRQVNRMQKRAIHAVGFGAEKKSEQSFLAGLARESGGRVVFR